MNYRLDRVRLCRACWDRLHPDREPVRVLDDDDAATAPKPRCHECRAVTREGIHVRMRLPVLK